LRKEMGAPNFIDITGQRFGRLVVIEKTKIPEGNKKDKRIYWLCKCDCGNERVVSGGNLHSGNTKSCGCKRKKGVRTVINGMFGSYKRGARDRNFAFGLSRIQFEKTIVLPCYYCGNIDKKSNYNKTKEFYLNGIDRIDSSKGYEIDNVVPCCTECNFSKGAMPKQEFLEHIEKIYEYSITIKK